MTKKILFAALFLSGCNFGTSIADQPTSHGSPAGTGGLVATSSGGTVTSDGGSTGSAGIVGPSVGGASSTGGVAGTAGATGGGGATDPGVGKDAGVAGEVGEPSGTGGAAGGASGQGGVSGTGGATTACIPAATRGQSGMNSGRACVTCHGAGQAPKITAGGTLYSTAAGGAAVAGATVTITGSDGKVVTLVTGNTGNFYTGAAIAFPASVQISKCPDTVTMATPLALGDCNSCHVAGKRIHLP